MEATALLLAERGATVVLGARGSDRLKNDLARAMVAQSEQAFLAIAQGNAPKEETVKILEYKEMEPFFVKGESDEP